MNRLLKAAFCAAAVVCAADAHAARTVTLTFETTGGGARSDGIGANGPIFTGFQSAIVQYVVNVTDGFPIFTNYNGSGQTTFTLSSAGLVFDFQTVNSTAFSGANGTVCFDGSAGLNPGIVQSNPACSSLSYEQRSPSGVGSIGFMGTITRFTVADGNTLSTGSNFSFTSIVPEPTTWALMVAGLGLTAFALRRRRTKLVIA